MRGAPKLLLSLVLVLFVSLQVQPTRLDEGILDHHPMAAAAVEGNVDVDDGTPRLKDCENCCYNVSSSQEGHLSVLYVCVSLRLVAIRSSIRGTATIDFIRAFRTQL